MNVCRCLVFLDKATDIGQLLISLLDKNEDDKTLLVYQMGFELVDNATQQFRTKVIETIPQPAQGKKWTKQKVNFFYKQKKNREKEKASTK